MSKYHLGDKFIVEVKEALESNNGTLYRSNFSTLVFDDYGLDKLQKYDEIGHRLELIDELKQAEYNKGLKDAWELARKISDMDYDAIEKALGIVGNLWMVVREMTAEEALAKIEAYEREKEIKVGDVVKMSKAGFDGIVTLIKGGNAFVMYDDGSCGEWKADKLIKTGKHIEGIESLLRQIGE